MNTVEVTRTYRETTAPGQLRATTDGNSQLQRVADCPAAFARSPYIEVGQRYCWTDCAVGRIALDGATSSDAHG
jgi:hypothetical protein